MALKIKKTSYSQVLTFLRKFVFIHYNSKHLHYFSAIALMMEAAGRPTSETSVNNYFTRQYIPEGKSESAKNVHLIQTQFVLNGTV
jgi:hypothetical protein